VVRRFFEFVRCSCQRAVLVPCFFDTICLCSTCWLGDKALATILSATIDIIQALNLILVCHEEKGLWHLDEVDFSVGQSVHDPHLASPKGEKTMRLPN
jgi:hypothetical protein